MILSGGYDGRRTMKGCLVKEDRLPKWAQDELARLRRHVEVLKRDLGERPPLPRTNAHIQSHSDSKYVPIDAAGVRFFPDESAGQRIFVEVFLDGGRMAIYASGEFSITPSSSNWAYVTVRG